MSLHAFIKPVSYTHLSYNANLRSSSSYWYMRSQELLDMVEELGTPTVFITLSTADLYWPEIYRILDLIMIMPILIKILNSFVYQNY